MKGLHFGEEKKRRREDEEKKRRKEGEVILIKPKDPHLAGVEKEPTPLVFGFFGVGSFSTPARKSHQQKKQKKPKQNLHFPWFFCFFLGYVVGVLFSFCFIIVFFLEFVFLVCFLVRSGFVFFFSMCFFFFSNSIFSVLLNSQHFPIFWILLGGYQPHRIYAWYIC